MESSHVIVEDARREPSALSQLRVLVVEDQKNTSETLRIMLRQLGVAQVTTATNGKEAFDIIEKGEQPIDLILCDWNMPKMTGIEFLRQIRGAQQQVPFLMITARGDENSVEVARNSGVTGYILKPFSLGELEKKILAVLQLKISHR